MSHWIAEAHDLFYLGGGQDRDQQLCAEDLLATKRDALHAAAARGAVILGVCGGYQLLGRSYELGPGEELPGVGLLDVRTVREDGPRLIGNVAIEVSTSTAVASAFSPASRTTAGAPTSARASPRSDVSSRVMATTGCSGFEGARSGNVIGTYLHGPLLPKNAWFADWLIATALGIDPGSSRRSTMRWSARPTAAPIAARA